MAGTTDVSAQKFRALRRVEPADRPAGRLWRLNMRLTTTGARSGQGERVRVWTLADRVFPGFATYRERAARAGRTIPLVQLVAGS